MKKISRRSFLAVCGAMAATAALTACGGSSASTAGTAASGSTAGSAASGDSGCRRRPDFNRWKQFESGRSYPSRRL